MLIIKFMPSYYGKKLPYTLIFKKFFLPIPCCKKTARKEIWELRKKELFAGEYPTEGNRKGAKTGKNETIKIATEDGLRQTFSVFMIMSAKQ